MSFAAALDAATALATEYTKLSGTISGMAVGADHDPNWGPADDEALNNYEAQRSELRQKLATALAALARDYRTDWQSYLAASTGRLDVLTKNAGKSWVVGEYERDQWTRWTKGALPAADQPEIFARGINELSENRELIDRAMRKT